MNENEKLFRFHARFITDQKRTDLAVPRLTDYLRAVATSDKQTGEAKGSVETITETYRRRFHQPVDRMALEHDRAYFARWWKEEKKRKNREAGLKGVQARISTQLTEEDVKGVK